MRSISIIAFTLSANSSSLLWVDFKYNLHFDFLLYALVSCQIWKYHEKCICFFTTRNVGVWAFQRPSEQIFLINRPLRAPRKLSWVYIIEMRIKKVKISFYQLSSFYLEIIITHITKQPKFPRCRFLSMFRRSPSIIPRVHCKLKRMTGQLLETHGHYRLE